MTAFVKMHGLGNDFVIFDARDAALSLTPDQARAVADRHFGIGCDTIVIMRPGDADTDAFVQFINADGSESGAWLSVAPRRLRPQRDARNTFVMSIDSASTIGLIAS